MTVTRAHAQELTRAAVARYAREPGRSAMIAVHRGLEPAFVCGALADEPRPGASLFKVPLAMAAETALADGALDPARRVPVAEVLRSGARPHPLSVLSPTTTLSPAELIGLMISLSDNDAASWVLAAVGFPAVEGATHAMGCMSTAMRVDSGQPVPEELGGKLTGSTTARDALRFVSWLADPAVCAQFPVTANALRNSVHNSRIPLGVRDSDIAVAHKTGTLGGVANDVARLECRGGWVEASFLSDSQHDTLVTGYEMGMCIVAVLNAWGLSVAATRALP